MHPHEGRIIPQSPNPLVFELSEKDRIARFGERKTILDRLMRRVVGVGNKSEKPQNRLNN